jgi:hypothetical protein
MSHKEWMDWLDYFERNGRLDPIRMYDRGSAQLCSIVTKALGGSGSVEDFLPYKPKPKLDNLDDFVKAFGMVKNGRSR